MKNIGEIFQTDYIQERERTPLDVERNWHKWLEERNHDPDAIEVLAQYADALVRAGVDLTNFDLIDTITGHLWYLEDAILFTLSKKHLNDATGYLIEALRSQGRMWKHQAVRTQPYLPIYTADGQSESSPPPPGYFESVKQMLQSKRKNSSILF